LFVDDRYFHPALKLDESHRFPQTNSQTKGGKWWPKRTFFKLACLEDVSLATDGTRLAAAGATGSYPFNRFIYTSGILAGVRMANEPSRQVALSGLVGRIYQIQSADTLSADANNWRANASLQSTNAPFVWADPTAANSARFYRGAWLP
jgi:hypothetical protein